MTRAVLAVRAPPLVEEFAITVAAAAVFGYLAQRVGLVSIVGFLAARVVAGAWRERRCGFAGHADVIGGLQWTPRT